MKVRLTEDYQEFTKGTVGYSSLVEQRMMSNKVDRFCTFRGENKEGEFCRKEVPKKLLKVLGENDSPFEDSIDKKAVAQDVNKRTAWVDKLSDSTILAHVLLECPFSVTGYVAMRADHDPIYYTQVLVNTISSLEMSDTANTYLNETCTEHIVVHLQANSYEIEVKHKKRNSQFSCIDGKIFFTIDTVIKVIFETIRPHRV